jgi:hypothetical protein
MFTHPHLARKHRGGMLARAHQRPSQFRNLASAPSLRAPSPRRPGTHPEGHDPDAR